VERGRKRCPSSHWQAEKLCYDSAMASISGLLVVFIFLLIGAAAFRYLVKG
jgi:Na+-transporting methylmalonyl-CoA/oxaloacetate decarboxylase gamma subunit